MLERWARVAMAMWFAATTVGCTIITTTDGGDPNPPPRPRPRHTHGRPLPPPPPRTPAGPRPAPVPAPGARPAAQVHGGPETPPQPPKEEPPRTPTRPSTMAPGVAAGRPAGFTPGARAAYWIWQGPRGDWRIRTTTQGAAHVFRGRVTPIKTEMSSVSPSRTEFRERVWKSGDSWSFAFATAGHADGFTFATRDNGCVKFDLQIDGGPEPKRIVIGKSQAAPPTNHFILCPHGKSP